jgi:hypothetical protein
MMPEHTVREGAVRRERAATAADCGEGTWLHPGCPPWPQRRACLSVHRPAIGPEPRGGAPCKASRHGTSGPECCGRRPRSGCAQWCRRGCRPAAAPEDPIQPRGPGSSSLCGQRHAGRRRWRQQWRGRRGGRGCGHGLGPFGAAHCVEPQQRPRGARGPPGRGSSRRRVRRGPGRRRGQRCRCRLQRPRACGGAAAAASTPRQLARWCHSRALPPGGRPRPAAPRHRPTHLPSSCRRRGRLRHRGAHNADQQRKRRRRQAPARALAALPRCSRCSSGGAAAAAGLAP